MTDIGTLATPRLYSQTMHGERGNFEYRGDVHWLDLPLSALISRIQTHLEARLPC